MAGKKKITGSLEVSGSIVSIEKPLVVETKKILWADLVALRDAGELIPGQQYRITDYECTTTQSNTQSAGHQFDIIVTADDVDKLNENARACLHEGDTYFANSKLEAWKLKYCLDNDTSRFAWADEVNGKGVIYRMIDEFNNDVPYDFKNIQFKRKITDGQYDPVSGDETWVYTFTGISYEYSTLVDGTVLKASEYFTDEGSNLYKNNKIGIYEYKRFFEDGYDNIVQQCNDIVFIGRYDEEPYVEEGPAKLVLFSYDNVFGAQCYNMTFGANCYFNTFGNNCDSNTFGANCHSNTFGNYCYSNTFGNNCYSNTFGDYCYSNTFGNVCSSNTFGNNCGSNTFGNNCYYNNFGNNCGSNTFGDDCYSNTFGNGCSSNTFGNYCGSNTFGNYCRSNTFGDGCSSNTFGNYCQYLKISDNTDIQKKYISVDSGVQGASSVNRFDLYDTAILNKNYQVTFKKSASGKYLMLWATDTGTMTGKVKDSNIDTTWEDIV